MTLFPVSYGGDVQTTLTAIYSPVYPSYITDLRFYSRSATPQTVEVHVTPNGGTDGEWGPKWPLAQGETAVHVADGERRLLGAGDVVLAVTTSGTAVAWALSANEDR